MPKCFHRSQRRLPLVASEVLEYWIHAEVWTIWSKVYRKKVCPLVNLSLSILISFIKLYRIISMKWCIIISISMMDKKVSLFNSSKNKNYYIVLLLHCNNILTDKILRSIEFVLSLNLNSRFKHALKRERDRGGGGSNSLIILGRSIRSSEWPSEVMMPQGGSRKQPVMVHLVMFNLVLLNAYIRIRRNKLKGWKMNCPQKCLEQHPICWWNKILFSD